MMRQILHSARIHLESTPNAGHDIAHTLRVRDLCLHIGSIEGGDPDILEASALLHDIGRPAELKDPANNHAASSAQLLAGRGIMAEKRNRFLQIFVDQFIHEINTARGPGNG